MRNLKFAILMPVQGYFREVGWINSYVKRLPLDQKGNPLPWLTYSFIDFIEKRLTQQMELFEYGSGNSTLFYASRVKHITAVEHDHSWYNQIKSSLPENTSLILRDLNEGKKYTGSSHENEKKFHMIIVDGRKRSECIYESIDSLTADGILILDDSERDQYSQAMEHLISKNFKRLDFWGFSPGFFYKKCTTVFYKENNILNI